MKAGAERMATTAVFLANGLGMGAWAVEVPRVKEMLTLSHSALGLALFAFALGALAAMGLTGRLVAKVGSGRGTALMGGAFVLTLPLPALAPDFGLLCLALFILGASSGAMDVAMNGHASALEARRERPIMSSFHAAWSLGGLLGAALGAAIHAGGLSVAAGLVLPDLAIAALVLAGAGIARRAGAAPARGAGGLLLPSAAVWKLAGLAFIALLVEGAVADWSAVYLRTALTARAGAAALGYSSFALTMAACRLVGDRSVRRLGSRAVVTFGGLSAAAGFALVLGLPSVLTACLGFALVGLGLANIVPVVFSAAGRSTQVPAVGISMAATVGYVGLLVGPPLIGFGASLVGLRLALGLLFLATAGVGLFGAKAVA
jgi:MFS family permease